MNTQVLQVAFQHSRFVQRFFYYDSIGSTNDKAKQLAVQGMGEGTLVIAEEQTAGRGRGDRTWYSAPGRGIYVSFLFRPKVPADSAFGLLAAVSLGAASAAQAVGVQGLVGIKWPNDLVVEGKKLAGILSEVSLSGGMVDWAVVGLGLNVNHAAEEFPMEIRERAVSLRMLCLREIERERLLIDLVERTAAWYEEFLENGTAALVPEWRRRSALVGRMVRVETPGETYLGRAVALEDDGALRVRLESGAEEVIRAGDVNLVQYR